MAHGERGLPWHGHEQAHAGLGHPQGVQFRCHQEDANGWFQVAGMADLSAISQSLGLAVYRRHIFLCADQSDPQCCSREAGLESWEYLKRRLKELALTGPESPVFRT